MSIHRRVRTLDKKKADKTIITFILGDLKPIQSINTSCGHNESFRFNLLTPPVVIMNPSDSIIHIVFYSCYCPLAKSCRIGFELLPLACLIYPTKVFYSGLIGYIVLWQRVVV
ncbi:hypothetical protein BDE02_10G008800 [Populus trichocarpa]|nr:hypothetical protein BDE02_10G008800 [Populus trichocarpa]